MGQKIQNEVVNIAAPIRTTASDVLAIGETILITLKLDGLPALALWWFLKSIALATPKPTTKK